MIPAVEAVERFAADLAALGPIEGDIGLAVSGGPDSLALLLLAAAARPGSVAVATVDHRLRPDSATEAKIVGAVCARIGVPHSTLSVDWGEPPTANLQARAREQRYELLAQWAREKGICAVATAHHADDQAETLVMRLSRGAGIRGLGGIRPRRSLDGDVDVIRPLLGWRRAQLAQIVEQAGLVSVDDPANHDPRHDRTRVRGALANGAQWPDALRLAAVATNLREAGDALDWALKPVIHSRVTIDAGAVLIDASGVPREFQRRLLQVAFTRLRVPWPAGPELTRAIAALDAGRIVTLGGVKLEPGPPWRLTRAPPHRQRTSPS